MGMKYNEFPSDYNSTQSKQLPNCCTDWEQLTCVLQPYNHGTEP